MDRLLGQRIELFKIHHCGRVDAYIYRGRRGRMIGIAAWHGEPMSYYLEPTSDARNVRLSDAGGLWQATLADCVRYAKGWE